MEVLVTLIGLTLVGWWVYRIGKGASQAGRATYQWASNLGKDTIQILEDADPTGEQTARLKMSVCFVRLAVLVAAADGKVSEDEIACIYNFFHERGADQDFMDFVTRILREAAKDTKFEETIGIVEEILPDKESKLFLCVGLFQVSAADGSIDESELRIIFGIMEKMGLSEDEVLRFSRQVLNVEDDQDEKATALVTLGLEDGATDSEIKKAYRRLAHQYHPDKVASLGPEFAELAHEKFVQINNAYELLAS